MKKFLSNFRRYKKDSLLSTRINPNDFQNLEFKNNWNNLVDMYDLRMWYMENTRNPIKGLDYTIEVENLHNELNYLFMRGLK